MTSKTHKPRTEFYLFMQNRKLFKQTHMEQTPDNPQHLCSSIRNSYIRFGDNKWKLYAILFKQYPLIYRCWCLYSVKWNEIDVYHQNFVCIRLYYYMDKNITIILWHSMAWPIRIHKKKKKKKKKMLSYGSSLDKFKLKMKKKWLNVRKRTIPG